MAVSLPTSADVRKVRTRANKVVNAQIDLVRTPFLAWVGAGDLAVNKVNDAVAKARTEAGERRAAAKTRAEKLQEQISDLPERLKGEELRKRYDEVSDEARKRYTELADRGEETLERLRKQPRVAKVLEVVEDATERIEKNFDKVVDSAHDRGEEVLGRVSTETRSAGEKAARATKRFSSEAATAVNKAADEVAEEIVEAGDDAAHAARSATRKVANRTAPRKPTTAKASTSTNGAATKK